MTEFLCFFGKLKYLFIRYIDILQVALSTLWGIRLVIFAKQEHKNKISHVQQSTVKTGLANALGKFNSFMVFF